MYLSNNKIASGHRSTQKYTLCGYKHHPFSLPFFHIEREREKEGNMSPTKSHSPKKAPFLLRGVDWVMREQKKNKNRVEPDFCVFSFCWGEFDFLFLFFFPPSPFSLHAWTTEEGDGKGIRDRVGYGRNVGDVIEYVRKVRKVRRWARREEGGGKLAFPSLSFFPRGCCC